MGIGSDKSARAEHDPSEIAGGNHTDIGESFLFQHIQNRASRRSLRFPVIGAALQSAVPQDIGINVVSRVPVLFSFLLNKPQGIFLCFAWLDRPNKPGLALYKFILCVFPDRPVGGFHPVFIPFSLMICHKITLSGAKITLHRSIKSDSITQ